MISGVVKMKLYNSHYERFLEYIKGKNLICYGVGKMLDEMSEVFTNLSELCSSIQLVDSSTDKCGMVREVYGNNYIVTGLKEALSSSPDAVILITSGAFLEILKTLEECVPDDVIVFSFLLMRKENYEKELITIEDCDEILGKHDTEQIPRVIHYFWFGGKEIPDDYKKNIETWHKCCPDYEIIRWGEENCNLDECKYVKEAYEQGRYGFVPDYFRLKVIYEQGGIYLDTDVKLLKALDELLFLEAYAGFEDNAKVALGVGFGARKGFQILKEMYEAYENLSFVNEDGTLNTIASPTYQTEVLKRHGLKCNGHMQTVDGMTILPMNYLTVQSNHTGRQYITKNSFSIHQYAASWFTDKDRESKRRAEELLQTMEMI